MNKKLLLVDLAVCSLCALVVLGSRSMTVSLGYALLLLLVFVRITLSFVLHHKEKKAWLPLVLLIGLGFLLAQSKHNLEFIRLMDIPFSVLAVETGMETRIVLINLMRVWLFLLPIVIYSLYMLRKGKSRNELSWQDVSGAVLWKDKTARTYSQLMLIAIMALLAGLVMDTRLSLLVCVLAPIFGLNVLSNHCGILLKYLWMLPVSMLLFFFAQYTAGVWRIGLLGGSLALMVYPCSCFARQRGRVILSFVASLYLGVWLPGLSVGYNQYACINYARVGEFYLSPYRGIFVVEDSRGGKMGLRDRYGLLVKPEYDEFAWHGSRHWFGLLELRRNGYVTLYDVCNNRTFVDDDINHALQDSICKVVYDHMASCSYAFDDRLEVTVRNGMDGKVISHVRVVKNGDAMYYSYDQDAQPFIKECSDTLQSGCFAVDTVYIGSGIPSQKQMLHYSQDIRQGDVTLYAIDVKSARDEVSQQKELMALTQSIVVRLKGRRE